MSVYSPLLLPPPQLRGRELREILPPHDPRAFARFSQWLFPPRNHPTPATPCVPLATPPPRGAQSVRLTRSAWRERARHTCTAAARVHSARPLSYAAEPCCAVEWRMACATAFLFERLVRFGVAQQEGDERAAQVLGREGHARLALEHGLHDLGPFSPVRSIYHPLTLQHL